MIAAFGYLVLEWSALALAGLFAAAASTAIDMSIAAMCLVCAGLLREMALHRATSRRVEMILDHHRTVSAPANDGGRDGR